jgi:hypothetical protein
LGIARGLVHFAVPSLGLQFRARVEGTMVDLEFAAFFSLLESLRSRLRQKSPVKLHIASSNPQFVYSFAGGGKHIPPRSERYLLLQEYQTQFDITVTYILRSRNRALLPPADLPATPTDENSEVDSTDNAADGRFGDLERGIKL